eukprot:CFRG4236T1
MEKYQQHIETYKVKQCTSRKCTLSDGRRRHCPKAHTCLDRRRNPFQHLATGSKFLYTYALCENVNVSCNCTCSTIDLSSISCPRHELCPSGDHCDNAHNFFEIYHHPLYYKTRKCRSREKRSRQSCLGGTISYCPELHEDEEISSFGGKTTETVMNTAKDPNENVKRKAASCFDPCPSHLTDSTSGRKLFIRRQSGTTAGLGCKTNASSPAGVGLIGQEVLEMGTRLYPPVNKPSERGLDRELFPIKVKTSHTSDKTGGNAKSQDSTISAMHLEGRDSSTAVVDSMIDWLQLNSCGTHSAEGQTNCVDLTAARSDQNNYKDKCTIIAPPMHIDVELTSPTSAKSIKWSAEPRDIKPVSCQDTSQSWPHSLGHTIKSTSMAKLSPTTSALVPNQQRMESSGVLFGDFESSVYTSMAPNSHTCSSPGVYAINHIPNHTISTNTVGCTSSAKYSSSTTFAKDTESSMSLARVPCNTWEKNYLLTMGRLPYDDFEGPRRSTPRYHMSIKQRVPPLSTRPAVNAEGRMAQKKSVPEPIQPLALNVASQVCDMALNNSKKNDDVMLAELDTLAFTVVMSVLNSENGECDSHKTTKASSSIQFKNDIIPQFATIPDQLSLTHKPTQRQPRPSTRHNLHSGLNVSCSPAYVSRTPPGEVKPIPLPSQMSKNECITVGCFDMHDTCAMQSTIAGA